MHVSRSDAGSNAAFQRAVHALQTMCCEDIGTPPSTPIRETIIGVAPATRYTQESNSDMPKIPYNFNASQREAVLLAMVNDMTLVKGPPGTGTTKVSVCIMENWVNLDPLTKVMATSTCHEAVHNLARGLLERHVNAFRTGHIDSLPEELSWYRLGKKGEMHSAISDLRM